nr:reverse transcriptase domain-containing protein [Tanacetum cinerariifolium]
MSHGLPPWHSMCTLCVFAPKELVQLLHLSVILHDPPLHALSNENCSKCQLGFRGREVWEVYVIWGKVVYGKVQGMLGWGRCTVTWGKRAGTVFRVPPYPFNYPTRRLTMEQMMAKFIDEALVKMPKYAKYLKSLLTNKSILEEDCTVTMNERCSVVLRNKLSAKEKDPGSFTIPCQDSNLQINNALADLGASISLMPYTMYQKLGLGEPKPTRMSLELVDRVGDDEVIFDMDQSNIKTKDKKEAENLVANHLSRLENLHMKVLTGREITDESLDEHLMVLRSKFKDDDPWAIKRILKRLVGYNPKDWLEKHNDALWAFRTAYKTSTGCTSFRLVYGKACHLPIEIEHKAHWDLTGKKSTKVGEVSINLEFLLMKSTMENLPSKTSGEFLISNLVEIVNKQVIAPAKAVKKTCVTCGGAHAYYDCIAIDSNQPSVCAATGSYNQVSPPNRASHQIPPPGFAPNNQGYRAQMNNASNFQNQSFQNQPFSVPNNQIPPSVPNEFSSNIKSNEIMIKSMQNQINVLSGDFNKQEGNLRRNLNNDMRSILGSFFQNQPSTSGTLPTNTVPNPKGEMTAVTTRSGLAYERPSIPTNSPLEKVDEQNTEEILDKEHSKCPGSTAQVQPPVVPISIPKPDVPRTQTKPTIPYPSRLNDQKLREKATYQMEKFFQIFHDLHFDISFTNALLFMPKFASIIKSLLANKDKLFGLAKVPLNENYSAMLLKKLPEKLGDLGKFHFPTDFVVVDFEADPRVPLILGRSFLRTGRALIDVYGEEITLRGDILYLENLLKENPFQLPSMNLKQAKSPIEEPEYSLSIGYEPLSTTPATELDEVTESSVKNLVPIPSEYEVTSDNESEYEVPVKDDSSSAFINPLFNDKDDFTSNDNESIPEKDVLIEEFKDYSNPHFDDDEINFDEIDPHCLNVESNFVESRSNHDTLKFDYLEEFSGALMPIRIADEERIRREHAEYISLMERLITINPCPRPMENVNTIVKSLPSSPILVQDSDSQREEIDIVTGIDELLPPSFKNDDYDSEGEIYVLEELLVENSIPSSKNELFDFYHNNLLFLRPPLEPPDVEFDFEPNSEEVISAVMNNIEELIDDECFDP